MKQLLIIFLLYSVGAVKLTKFLTDPLHHGGIAPKLSLVASVDGKTFFLDNSRWRNRTQAYTYCEGLGMQLAEITSRNQFTALDQAIVGEWVNGVCAWTGGVEAKTILRFGWENSNEGAHTYIPYRLRLVEDSNYFLVFWKYRNGSYLTNAILSSTCPALLCETLPNEK